MNEQFLKRMQLYLQEDYEDYLKTLDEEAFRGIRVNTAKITETDFLKLGICDCRPSAICPSPFIYQRI